MSKEVNFNGINNVVFLKTLLCDQFGCTKEELDFKAVTKFTLEHMNLLKINCLWPLSNLKQLNLSDNAIKRIENLDSLVHLEDLNLSFNEISKLENLQTLTKLRKLSLYSNRIKVLENLENLKDIKILNLGANCIDDHNCPFYFAQFKNLRSLVISENPCYSQPNEINEYLLALMPQLLDLNYRKVTDKDRYLATTHYKMKTKGLKKFGMAKAEKLKSKLPKIRDTSSTAGAVEFFNNIFLGYSEMLELSDKGENFSSLNSKLREKVIELYLQIQENKNRQRKIFETHNNIYDDLETESVAAKKRLILSFGAYNTNNLQRQDTGTFDGDKMKQFRMTLLEEECDAQYRFERLFKELEDKLTSQTAELVRNVKLIFENIVKEMDFYSATMIQYIANCFQKNLRVGSEPQSNSKEDVFWDGVNLETFKNEFRNSYVKMVKEAEAKVTNELHEWRSQVLEMFKKNLVRHRKSVAEIKKAVEALKLN